MGSDRNFIWIKLLWSAVIVFSLTLLLYIKHTKADGIIGFGIYPYILAPYTLGLSALLIILRFTISKSARRLFIYLFAGTISLFIGLVGIYLDASSQTIVDYTFHILFYLNSLLAIFMFFDSLKK